MEAEVEEENTAIIQMKGSLADFWKPSPGEIRSRLRFGSAMDVSVADSTRLSTNRSSLSMQHIIDKEKKEKERHQELIKSKTYITELQDKLENVETTRKRARVEYERELSAVKQEAKRGNMTVEQLKDQLNLILQKEEHTDSELKQTRAELLSVKANHERKVFELQKLKTKLEMDVQEMDQESKSQMMQLRNDNLRKDSELKISSIEIKELKEQLLNLQRRYSESKKQLEELEESRSAGFTAEQRVKDLENQLSRMEGDAVIARTMKDQLDRLNSLEKENRTLLSENTYRKETQENVFLLREEVEGLKDKLERSEQRCHEYNQLKLEHEDIKRTLQQWECLNEESNRPLSPSELKRRVSDLQTSNASLLEHQGQLQASSHTLEASLRAKEKDLSKTKEQLIQDQAKVQQLEGFIKRIQKKLLLVSKERDSYKVILDSYENEMTVNVATAGLNQFRGLQGAVQGWESYVASLEKQTEENTRELAQARARVKLLENKLRNSMESSPMTPSKADVDTPVVLQLRDQVAGLEKRLEEVLQAKQQMEDDRERQTMLGSYDTARTKVIHFTNNPVAMAHRRRQDEFQALKDENRKLKTRVEVLEKQECPLEDLTQQVQAKIETPASSKEMEEMASQVKSAELKNQRLMEVFKKKTHELREAVYQLLGVKIHIPCDGQYRLMNMYAESPDDFLLFQQGDDGQFQMLSTEYSSTLEDTIDTYLTQGNSIPAFLSNLTMSLFSTQTVLQ